MAAKEGDTVKVHYTGTLADGSEFDTSRDREPLELTLGKGEVIEGFENAILGMEPGETKTFTITSGEAYGEHDADKLVQVQREAMPDDLDLEIGRMLEMQTEEGGRVIVTIAEFDEQLVSLDANHPLAGKDLTFELQLVEVG